ncbi:hypothetical protein ATANTOWER_025805 [Ataeniobius toweri]|uniref:Uncharacterized protein n=1 Tax=Ataeniobius toweri TaxID=208326 RepID=A0ABU7AHE5_9TELE|nr:hypothetical protein [Ataeniobius toweri]
MAAHTKPGSAGVFLSTVATCMLSMRDCYKVNLRVDMNGNKWVLFCVADLEVGRSIHTNRDLLPGAAVSFLLAGNDITVGARWQTSVQSQVQSPKGE